MNKKIEAVKLYLQTHSKGCTTKVFVGFDGYVDTIVRPVLNSRPNGTNDYFSTIEEFGKYLQTKAGKGCCIELDKAVEKSGGNAYLFANALAGMAIDTTCLGAFGYPKIHEAFQDAESRLHLISIASPGFCSALEFLDGKIMLGESAGINQMDYAFLKEHVGEEQLIRFCEEAEVISFMNWSELKGSTSIWQGFLREIFPKMKATTNKKMFLDISDCSNREKKDIIEMLQMIREMGKYFEVILSLNANEFRGVSNVLPEFDTTLCDADEKRLARFLYEFCGLKHLYIHLRDGAVCIDESKEYIVKNKLIQKPKVSTGGGDNFNAGLLLGLLIGLEPESAMIIGNAASGYYITHGESPSLEDLEEYLTWWCEEEKMKSY